MSRKIDISKANEWSAKEYDDYTNYFSQRSDYSSLREIERVLKEGKPAEAPEKITDGTIAEVLEWVGEDVDRAQQALDEENYKDSPRKTLVDELEALIDSD